jgi:hypothetical protein
VGKPWSASAVLCTAPKSPNVFGGMLSYIFLPVFSSLASTCTRIRTETLPESASLKSLNIECELPVLEEGHAAISRGRPAGNFCFATGFLFIR